ncbi:fibroblast growth factor-binding protein 2b [Leuresthes tenuis]|uniref:fibroblast growth factor-binding protein 2b n=1 Tax=Leuresthes tenuis TaxID=355514 RepID=UPI003B4FFA9A
MRARMRVLLLLLAATVSVSNAQTSNDSKQPQHQPRSIWDDPIRFNTKNKDSCTMVVSGAGNYTRLRVSCKGPSQTTGRSYYCDFQGKPGQCRAYNQNPRHYFTQMMWELRKLKNACQGPKIYRPHMCRKCPDEAQMTFLTSWPKTTTPKNKPVPEIRKPMVPAQPKPAATSKPVKPQSQPVKPPSGKGPQTRKTTPKPGKTITRPTEQPVNRASRLASEYCWKSFQGICNYVFGWFQE